MTKFSFNLFHLFFNTIFIFFVLTFTIECLLVVFRIKNARARAYLRLTPLLKIILDIILYEFAYKVFYNLNPFGCKTYLNKWLHHFLSHPILETPSIGIAIASLFTVITLFFLVRKVCQIAESERSLRSILRKSSPSCRKIENQKLKTALCRAKTKIVVSPQTIIPFATASSHIVLPAALESNLDQQEFEAILSHELGHIRSKDPILKVVLSLLASLLWWMPLKWWIRMIEKEQEEACDQEIQRYQISSLALAEGLVKTLSLAKKTAAAPPFVCSAIKINSSHILRLKTILHPCNGHFKRSYLKLSLALCPIAILIFTIWVC